MAEKGLKASVLPIDFYSASTMLLAGLLGVLPAHRSSVKALLLSHWSEWRGALQVLFLAL